MNKTIVARREWEEIRGFFVRRPFLVSTNDISEEMFDQLKERKFGSFSTYMQQKLSVWIDGYERGRK